jgi:hypothetical protein
MTPEALFSLLSFHTRRVSNLQPLERHTIYFLLQNPILNFCYAIFLIFALTNKPHIPESLEYDSSSTNQDCLRNQYIALFTRARHLSLRWVVSSPHPLSYIFKVCFNIILRSTPRSAMSSIFFQVSHTGAVTCRCAGIYHLATSGHESCPFYLHGLLTCHP